MIEKTEKDIELEQANQEAIKNDEQLKNIAEDIKIYGEGEAFSKSAGGQQLIVSLENDVLDAILILTVKYKTALHIELISLCASLESKMGLLRRMTQTTKKKDEALKNYKDRLKEILGE